MAWLFRLCVGVVTVLAFCRNCCVAEENTTEPASPAVTHGHHHSNQDNHTDGPDPGWTGHFSKCPEDLQYYCIHGECRYVQEYNTPSCRCDLGYDGHRCEFLIIPDPITDPMKWIIIFGTVAGLLLLILFIVFICLSPRLRWRICWQRRRRREEPRNGTEKLSMMDAAAETHIASKSLDSTEPPPPQTTAV